MTTIADQTQRSTTIVSNVNPAFFPFDTSDGKNPYASARWQSLFGSFGIIHVKNEHVGENESNTHATRNDFLHKECCGNPMLATYHFVLTRNNHTTAPSMPYSKETERRALLEMARGYYEDVWQSLTIDEQLALYHLAKNRFIHVEHPGIDPLLRKGLIQFEPDLHIMNTSFREFVSIAGQRDELHKQEEQKGDSIWNVLKVPVGLGLATIIIVLLLTQEELRTALPAVISLLPLLFQGMPTLTQEKVKPL
ncbi:MAG: hypothetical protein NPIRA02_15370 [Nitrospirales bacterium]|nr:MAG: hypothetical protein NPIRA02_15370 [Nitrospirales bacterium]